MSDDARRLLELELEQWHRQCRRPFIAFCIEALSARGETPARHHRLICSELEAKRLALLYPGIAGELTRKGDAGRADAILIARSGLMTLRPAQSQVAQ